MAGGPVVLVVGPNWVGDMVMAHTLIRSLRQREPEAVIDVLAPPASGPIAARMAEVRRVIDLPFSPHRLALSARRTLARSMRGRYDRAFVLPGSWISALVPAMAGIQQRTGYLRELRYGLLTDIVTMPAGQKRKTAEAYARLGGVGELQRPRLEVDANNQRRLLEKHGLGHRQFVALVPGAEGGAAKRWPSDKYGSLARRLQAEGHQVVVLGSTRDVATTSAVTAAAPGAVDLGGATSLMEVVDLIAAARFAVTNDSGLMHVAAAVGTPVAGIYGSTSPTDTPPLTERRVTVWRGLSCSPCYKRDCPLGHTDCLNGLGVEAVAAAVRGLGA